MLQARDLVVGVDQVHTQDGGDRGGRDREGSHREQATPGSPPARRAWRGGTSLRGASSGADPSRTSVGMGGGSSAGRAGSRLAMLDHSPSGSCSTELPNAAATSRCASSSARQRGTFGQVGLDQLLLVAVHRVEGEHGEELTGLLVGHHASTPWTPASTSAARIRRMPLRMRLFTVPSGVSSSAATST